MAFWSRCDDSVHFRLFACSPLDLNRLSQVAVGFGNLGAVFKKNKQKNSEYLG